MSVPSFSQSLLTPSDSLRSEKLEARKTTLSPRELEKETEIEIEISLIEWIIYGRHLFRAYLINQINWSLELLPSIQRSDSPFLYFYFRLFTFLGSEDFYWGVLPLIYWISPNTGRQFMCLWALCIYVGDWFKNVFCLPRPPKSYIKGSEKALDNHGFGWPSLHSIHAIALPFFAIRGHYGYVWTWSFGTSDVQSSIIPNLPAELGLQEEVVRGGLILCWLLALTWMASVCFSRMYLGVHSPGDVQGGLIIGGLILQFWSLFSEPFDLWLTSSESGAFWVLFVGAFLVSIIPHVQFRLPVHSIQQTESSKSSSSDQSLQLTTSEQELKIKNSVCNTNEELYGVTLFMTGFLMYTNLFPNILQPVPFCQLSFQIFAARILIGFGTLAVVYLGITFLWKRYVEKGTSPNTQVFTRMRILKMWVKYGLGLGCAIVVLAPTLFTFYGV